MTRQPSAARAARAAPRARTAPGGAVQVLHDPPRPDDDDSVFVSFLREPATLDWV
ncbi:hypothetical protein AB0929_08585 [Streptomyces massasporeus]|uniref:hypothetical protein n=1 Tax=Streptomyces massasporeus TaxID=67324 RepID=UPI003454A6A9